MKKRILALITAGIWIAILTAGCGGSNETALIQHNSPLKGETGKAVLTDEAAGEEPEEDKAISLTSEIMELEDGFSAVAFQGDDGFEEFLAGGGAESDAQVVSFLSSHLLADFNILGSLFGCSTIAAASPEGEQLFGRNFDWQNCDALVVLSKPDQGYASLSTVNLDFISQGGGIVGKALQANDIRTRAALYAPLDGMNEAGLAVSVNMIQDSATINQSTEKPDLTTTTAIRLLLNKAANVEEALALLRQYDMHASMGMMVHFALSDTQGNHVAVEYVGNEMVVIKTPVLTNFYLAPGEKHGIGTAQSHERYNTLTQLLSERETMTMEDIRDALDSVSKDNFGEFESTEWSIAYNLNKGTAHYYHREDYETRYTFKIQ